MSEQEKEARIRVAAAEGRCPQCDAILGKSRVGSGRLSDGVFCSLECLSSFHQAYFHERITKGTSSSN